jgi:hypothetical protein
MIGELGVCNSPYFFQWQWRQLVCHSTIRQTPSRYATGIAKHMEQQLCPTFINNDLVIIAYSKEKEGIPYFDLFHRLHKMKQNFGLQIFPSFQITMEFEFWVWMVCHLGLIESGPKGHVGHNKKLNQGFPKPTFWHWWDPWGVFTITHKLSSLLNFSHRMGTQKCHNTHVHCSTPFP